MIPQLIVASLVVFRFVASLLILMGAIEVKRTEPTKAVRFFSNVIYNGTAAYVLYWGGFFDELIRRLSP